MHRETDLHAIHPSAKNPIKEATHWVLSGSQRRKVRSIGEPTWFDHNHFRPSTPTRCARLEEEEESADGLKTNRTTCRDGQPTLQFPALACYHGDHPAAYIYISRPKQEIHEGAGIAQWLEHRTRDWKVAGSNPCWNGGRIFFSRVDFLCRLLFRYPFHPRVTTVARKKSRSFCQKCRWQVTAKHAYTLRMWILLNRASALVTTCP